MDLNQFINVHSIPLKAQESPLPPFERLVEALAALLESVALERPRPPVKVPRL